MDLRYEIFSFVHFHGRVTVNQIAGWFGSAVIITQVLRDQQEVFYYHNGFWRIYSYYYRRIPRFTGPVVMTREHLDIVTSYNWQKPPEPYKLAE